MLQAITKRLKRGKRGISTVIVVMLSLVLVVIIVGNVVLWSYQMNQLDWEKMQENIAIVNAAPIGDIGSYNPSQYVLNGSPSLVSGSNLTADDGVYMSFRSYYSGTDASNFVDNNASNVDSSDGIGTHSNFPAQQSFNEGFNDTLTEGKSGISEDKYYPSGYNLLNQTTLASGTIGNLFSDDGVYMQFRSYASAYSGSSTFGNSTVGGSSQSIEDRITGSLFAAPNDGQAQSISAYIELTATPQTFGDASIESSTASIENTIRGARFAPTYDGVATSITTYIDVENMTFGHTVQESSTASIENTIRGSSFTCSENGTIQSITAYIRCTSAAKNMTAAIYNEGTHTLVAQTEQKLVPIGTTWVTFNFATPPSVTSGNSYVLVVWSFLDIGNANLYYHPGDSNQGHYLSMPYNGSYPSSLTFNHENREYSIYCTYSPYESRTVKAAVYSDAHTLIASTEEKTVSADGWVTFNFPSPPTLTAGTNYTLVAWSDSAGGAINMRYHTGSLNQGHSLSQTYGAWPSPASFSENNYEYSIYCTSQPSAKVKAAIYSDAHVLIASTEEKTVTPDADGWVTFNFPTSPTLTAGANYVLVAWSQDTQESVYMYYHSGSSNQGHNQTATYGNWPSPASFTHEGREYSIYCTYTSASEYTCEVEFTGSSFDTQPWTQLDWAIDSAWTTGSVSVTLQLYNYNLEAYPTGGDGYISYTSSPTPNTDELKTNTITINPTYFRDASGNWRLKITGVKATTTQFDCKVDLVEYKATKDNCMLDLEVQWTNAPYNLPNAELCIYGGIMGSEDIRVDVWDGAAWQNLFTDLTSGWNNVSVSSYLISQNFTIRFKDGAEANDTVQDSWNIDAALLHAWYDEYVAEVEFIGSSNTENWNQLNWTVNSAWTTSSVNVTLQLYNYTLGGYPTSGNGYIAYTSDSTPDTDENKSQTINVNPTDFRNATGYWKMKVKGVKADAAQFDFKADLIEFKIGKDGGTLFTFKNEGSSTLHIISLWITNSTHHQRYDINIFINSGDTTSHTYSNVTLPDKPYNVKVITERGNTAVFTSD